MRARAWFAARAPARRACGRSGTALCSAGWRRPSMHAAAKRALVGCSDLAVAPLGCPMTCAAMIGGERRRNLELSNVRRDGRDRGVASSRSLPGGSGTEIDEPPVLRFGCVLERPRGSVGRMTMLGHYNAHPAPSIGATPRQRHVRSRPPPSPLRPYDIPITPRAEPRPGAADRLRLSSSRRELDGASGHRQPLLFRRALERPSSTPSMTT